MALPVALKCVNGMCVHDPTGEGDGKCVNKRIGDPCTSGIVQPPPPGITLGCLEGKCIEVSSGAGTSNCIGKKVGDPCGEVGPTISCRGGVCVELTPGEVTIPENISKCAGRKVGDACGGDAPCTRDLDCDIGQICVDGKCVVEIVEEPLVCFKIPGAPGAKGECKKAGTGVVGDEECRGKKEGDICGGIDPGEECEGGYLGEQVKGTDGEWHLLKPCNDGFFPERYGDENKIWCCPPSGKDCVTDADCAEGEECIDDVCVKKGEGCTGGYRMPSGASVCEREGFNVKTINNEAWCCPEDWDGEDPCPGVGLSGGIKVDTTGFEGGKGQNMRASEIGGGFLRSDEWEGHWVWDPNTKKYYYKGDADLFVREGTPLPEGQDHVCPKYYTRTPEGTGQWCCYDPDVPDGGPGGEFEWGEDLQALLARIMERANELLDYPRGLTPEERQGVINYAIEGVKAGERGQLQSSEDALARMGLAGSGFQLQEAADIQRGTTQAAGDIRREMAIDELNRRFGEYTTTTGMAGDFTNLLMGAEQVPEILSGARRQEGQFATSSMLAYFSSLMGGQGSNQYWPAIFAQLMGQQGGGGGGLMDWLPWIFSLSDTGSGRIPV